jgi:hypothetical protein
MGVLLYRSALFAERQRHDLFEKGEFPRKRLRTNRIAAGNQRQAIQVIFPTPIRESAPASNCSPREITCCFPWSTSPPSKSRLPSGCEILLWTPAAVRTTPSFKGTELGEVLLPVTGSVLVAASR